MPHAGTNNTQRAKLKSPTWSRAPRPAAWTPPDAPVRLGPRAGVCGPRGHAGHAGPSSPVLPDADAGLAGNPASRLSRPGGRPALRGSARASAGGRAARFPGLPAGASVLVSLGEAAPGLPRGGSNGEAGPGGSHAATGAPVLPGGGRQAGRQAGCFHHVFFFLFGPVGIVYLIHRFSSVCLEDS